MLVFSGFSFTAAGSLSLSDVANSRSGILLPRRSQRKIRSLALYIPLFRLRSKARCSVETSKLCIHFASSLRF